MMLLIEICGISHYEKIEIREELLLFNDWLNETEMNATLNIGHEVGNFTVVKYLKTYGLNNAESYRVTDAEGNDAIMKLMVDGCSSLEFSQEVCELMSQTRAMPSVREYGVINVNSIDYKFMIRESVEGVKLSELLDMGITYTWEEAVPIVLQVVELRSSMSLHETHVLMLSSLLKILLKSFTAIHRRLALLSWICDD